MSHHQRQEGSATQGTSRPSAPPGTSPTAALGVQSSRANSRGQTAQSPLSNTVIPRDYLASRSDVQPYRKAKPSPLQASFFPQSAPNAEASSMPPQSNTDTSQTIHDQEPNSDGGGESTRPDRAGYRGMGQIHSSNMSNGISSNGDIMKPVARMGSSSYREQMGQSPPDSPVSISSSMKSETAPSGLNMPRNSSIDSAISNVSSTTNNPSKTSTNASQVTGAEIKNLIATAGSPENLIAYLLNEKQHAAAQNAQLWKLVEKQRSLLLGLNKDLEQLSKDKEKYKKKLKELQTQAPSVPKMPPPADDGESSATGDNATHERSPGNGSDKDSRIDYGLAMRTPEKSLATNPRSSPMDAAMLPPPLHTQQQRPGNISSGDLSNASASENTGSMHQNIPEVRFTDASNANAAAASANRQEESPVTSPVSSHEPSGRGAGFGGLQTTLKAPAVKLIEPSPLLEKSEKSFSSTKRTKPAPLNLNQSKRGSVMLLQSFQAEEHSDSEYEDPLDTGEERGRRKTREEDDRERELAAKQESEARSRSKRGKSAQADQKSSVSETVLTVPPVPVSGLPLSPRPTTVQPTFAQTNDRLIPPPPYSAVQIGSQDSSTISQRHLTAPLKSPGLPMSPRPIDRPLGSPLPRMPKDNAGVINSLPLSPRMMPPGMPLSPRAPRQPLPPHTSSTAFLAPSGTMMSTKTPADAGSLSQSNAASAPRDQNNADTSPTSPDKAPQVFRGYVDLNYPNLLLPPNALPSVLVKVTSPRLRPSRMSYLSLKPQEEAPVFMLSVYSRFDGRELWRAEKVIMALTQLDHQFQAVGKTTARLPDRKLFSGHSPATVDARRAALNSYFSDLLDTPMNEKAALIICSFLSTDVIEPGNGEGSASAGSANGRSTLTTGPDGRPRKEGYLTKRGKNFGGWKERFFVLHGPDLRYFESPGGAHLGSIKLQNAQIGKQSSSDSPAQSGDEAEGQYRHAFLILEPKRKDSSSLVRHILCAESDRERDEWVAALLHYVDDLSEDESSAKGQTTRADNEKSRTARLEAKVKQYASSMTGSGKDETMADNPGTNALKSISYADTAHGPPPLKRTAVMDRPNDTPSPTSTSSATTPHSMNNLENDHQQGSLSSKAISSPTNGGVIQDAEAWGNKPAVAASSFKDNYHKKRGLWNFRQKSSTDLSAQEQDLNLNQAQQTTSTERQIPVRAVFGLPLAEAVELCPPTDVDINLPAVVYRCLEYLRAKNAASEEGIFRLSGSSVVIKALKERFNSEGDVNLVADGQYYDVHAVASLFKLYLRELPTTVLTRELHLEFLPITELNDKNDKIAAFNTLVHRLPAPNFSLLRALSQYLLEVVNNSDQNKMSVRNVGIVFAPTLNIPAPVFAHFLNDFDAVFDAGVPSEGQTRSVEVNMPNTLAPVDIRSPRHQMFSDLPTPAYSQTSFVKGHAPSPFPAQSTAATQRAESPEDVGFTPIQPSYDARQYPSNPYGRLQGQQRSPPMQQQPLSSQAEYGSLNMMMTPQNALTLKAKRRESSMLFMG